MYMLMYMFNSKPLLNMAHIKASVICAYLIEARWQHRAAGVSPHTTSQ